MCAIACQSATMLVLCSNVTVSVKKCIICASVRLEWSLDQLGAPYKYCNHYYYYYRSLRIREDLGPQDLRQKLCTRSLGVYNISRASSRRTRERGEEEEGGCWCWWGGDGRGGGRLRFALSLTRKRLTINPPTHRLQPHGTSLCSKNPA